MTSLDRNLDVQAVTGGWYPGSPGVRDRLQSVTEVARTLSVCDATVYKLCARGLIGDVRILNAIRVPVASLGS